LDLDHRAGALPKIFQPFPTIVKITTTDYILKYTARFLLGIVAIFSISCGTTYPVTEVARSSAKSFTPPKGKALLYVYRPSGFIGYALPGKIHINKQEIGKLRSGTFLAVPIDPRRMSLQAGGPYFSTYDTIGQDFPEIQIDAKAGEVYFVRQRVSMGSYSSYIIPTANGPIPGGSGEFFFNARKVENSIGKAESQKLKQVGSVIGF
jgi:Protein of unknown function (DUF2846)